MSKVKFAVVGENRSALEHLRGTLEASGEVDMFHSDEELLRRGTPEDFQCVLIEAKEGLKLHLQLLEARCGTPLIYLSQQPSVSDAVKAMRLGAVDYLPYAVAPEVLSAALEAAERQKRTGVPDRHFCAGAGLEAKLDNMERELICEALQRSGGVVGGRNGAARMLGVTRTGLLYKMRRLNVSRAVVVDGSEEGEVASQEHDSGASAGAA